MFPYSLSIKVSKAIGRKAGTAYNLIVVIFNIIEMPNSSQNFTLVYLAVYGARPQNSELWH